MTNRDPNVPDFISKINDYYDCLNDYFLLKNDEQLKIDLTKPDIDLVCNYDLKQVKDHIRAYGLNYNDFFKLSPIDERKYLKNIHPQKYEKYFHH